MRCITCSHEGGKLTRLEMAWRGCCVCTCYHPLFCLNHLSDLERVLLRKGNVASADE